MRLAVFFPVAAFFRAAFLPAAFLRAAFFGADFFFAAAFFLVARGLAALASAWPAWMFVLKDYQKQRILTMLNPEIDKLGAGWNIIQSKTAIGSGGWDGKGWLRGTQSQLDFLPESHTDFIIAVLAEELGFVGAAGVLGLFYYLFYRGIAAARAAQIDGSAQDWGRLAAVPGRCRVPCNG